jgi:hypothetical protein
VFYRHTTPNLYGNLYMGNANFVGKVTLQPIFLMVSTLLQATNIVLTPSYPATAIIISCMFFLLCWSGTSTLFMIVIWHSGKLCLYACLHEFSHVVFISFRIKSSMYTSPDRITQLSVENLKLLGSGMFSCFLHVRVCNRSYFRQ